MVDVLEPHEDETVKKKKPKKLCAGLRRDLKLCILETDCVKIVSSVLKFSIYYSSNP